MLTAAVIVGLVRALGRDGPAALSAWRQADVNFGWVAVASFSGLAGQAIYVFGWRRLLMDCGITVTLWQAGRLFLVSNLGRYLPAGKAWQMGIVAVMAAEQDLPAAPVAATSLFQGVIGVVVGAILLFLSGGAVLNVAPVWLVVPILGVLALLALPALLSATPRLRALAVRRLPSIDSVTSATMWVLVWTAGISWIAWGLALYALAIGLLSDPVVPAVAFIAAWIGPFLAGIIAIVAPAGLGVRDELMRTMLTSAGLSSAGAIVLVVVSRVWTTALEIVPALAVIALRRASSPRTVWPFLRRPGPADSNH